MARMSLKVGIAVAIVAALFVAGWVAATSGGDGGGGASRAVVTRDEGEDKDDKSEGAAVQGSRMVWTGPLVDEAGLDGDQMDAVFERLQECMPMYRTPYVELCLQGREDSWYEEDGSAEEVE